MENIFKEKRGINLRDRKVLLVGFGLITGPAAVRALFSAEAQVMVTDIKGRDELGSSLSGVEDLPIQWELGRHPLYLLDEADLIVLSPGVPMDIPFLVKARDRYIPVISEIELAYHLSEARMIAITGTNGKTTTTTITGELIKCLPQPTAVGGNIGSPLVEVVQGLPADGLVSVEVSSFQLEGIIHFRPIIAAILNLTPDHLDRHGTFTEYIEAKKRVFKNQTADDILILNRDDPQTYALDGEGAGQTLFFSTEEAVDGVWLEGKTIYTNVAGRPGELELVAPLPLMNISDIRVPGLHNLENILASLLAARIVGVSPHDMARTVREFKGIEHRIEFVAAVNGVKYYNDSKGTNPVSSRKALEAFSSPVILLAGGQDRGADFNEMAPLILEKVRYLILLGETRDKIAEVVLKDGYPHNNLVMVDSIPDAVKEAARLAEPGDVVLLSPACPSWDMFPNYKERGRLFKEMVRKLGG
ncbi:MAG: UDP-N-acetylmuramoyl-L-alanine--D-glutamate ligase [Halanaerobium sp.]|nr:UDP-N-acetylmuramoyl-L-alanine--D-glutamate ligase [Halanaerobium sp.]